MDDDSIRPCLPSPVSHEDDDLLMGSEAIGVSQTWHTSRSHLQGAQMARVRKPPIRRHSPSNSMVTGRHFLQVPPELLGRRREATVPDEEGPIEPTTSEDSGLTLLRGFFS